MMGSAVRWGIFTGLLLERPGFFGYASRRMVQEAALSGQPR